MSRRTIHYWIDNGQLDRDLAAGARGYTPRPPVAHKPDPYEAIIRRPSRGVPGSSRRSGCSMRSARRVIRGGYKRVLDYVRATRPREPGDRCC